MPKKATFYASKIQELIYFDICGPSKVNSIRKTRYFLIFVDNSLKKL